MYDVDWKVPIKVEIVHSLDAFHYDVPTEILMNFIKRKLTFMTSNGYRTTSLHEL